MTPSLDALVEEMERAAKKATPGEWWPDPDAAAIFAGPSPGTYISQIGTLLNAEHIATANPANILALIADWRRMKRELVNLERNVRAIPTGTIFNHPSSPSQSATAAPSAAPR